MEVEQPPLAVPQQPVVLPLRVVAQRLPEVWLRVASPLARRPARQVWLVVPVAAS